MLTGTTIAFADTPAATQQADKATVTISTEKWREGKLVLRGTGFTSTAPGRRRSVRSEVPRRPAG